MRIDDRVANEGRIICPASSFLRERTKSGKSLAVTAEKRAPSCATDDSETRLSCRLTHGTLDPRRTQLSQGAADPDVFEPRSSTCRLTSPRSRAFRGAGRDKDANIRTMPELVRIGTDARYQARPAKRAEQRMVQLPLSGMVEVAMMLLLPISGGVASAVPPKAVCHLALGVFVSIVMVVTYHKINEYAREHRRSLGKVDRLSSPCGCRSCLFAALILVDVPHRLRTSPGRAADRRAGTRLADKSGKAIRKCCHFGKRCSCACIPQEA